MGESVPVLPFLAPPQSESLARSHWATNGDASWYYIAYSSLMSNVDAHSTSRHDCKTAAFCAPGGYGGVPSLPSRMKERN